MLTNKKRMSKREMPSTKWVQATPQEKSPRELEKRFPFSCVKFPTAKIKVREKYFREAIEKSIEK